MVTGLKNQKLRARLAKAITGRCSIAIGGDIERVEKIREITTRSVVAVGLAGILLACFFHGDPTKAREWTLASMALLLQTLTVVMTAPAFVPSNTNNRLAQLYLPISNKMISRAYFQRSKLWLRILLSAIAYMVLVCLCCRVDGFWVVTQLIWQSFVLCMLVHATYRIFGRNARYRWFWTSVWWIAAFVTGLGWMMWQALDPMPLAFFAAPLWAVLKVPGLVSQFAGQPVGMVFCLLALVSTSPTWRSALDWLSPSRTEIGKICRFWRTLPDRENPVTGNLNYPAVDQRASSDFPDPESSQPLSLRIRDQITRPDPQSLIPASVRRKAKVYAVLLTLSLLVLGTLTEIIMTKAGLPPGSPIGVAAITWHLPTVWSMLCLGSFAGSGLIHPADAYRLAARSVWRDTLLLALLCVPCVALIGHFTGDYESSATKIGIFLLIGMVVRVLSGILVWLPPNLLEVSLMGYALMAGFFVAASTGLSGESFVVVMLGFPLVFSTIGWDRIAKHLKRMPKSGECASDFVDQSVGSVA